VIGIIAVLISILLPLKGLAPPSGEHYPFCTVQLTPDRHRDDCLRAKQQRGYSGSPWTSGCSSIPATGYSDLIALHLPNLGLTSARRSIHGRRLRSRTTPLPAARVDSNFLSTYAPFQCPENDIVVRRYSGSPITMRGRQMFPINTASIFLYKS